MPVNEMQVPHQLMTFLWVLLAVYVVQVGVSVFWAIHEVNHAEADQAKALPADTEWEGDR